MDNDGDALLTGALYFNTTSDAMKVYTGAAWVAVAPVATSVTVSQISDYTGTATELNYTDGVTSSIQTQLDAKGVGSVTSVGGTGSVQGLTLSGSVTSSGNLTLGGSLSGINISSQTTGTLPVNRGGTGATSLTANNVLLGNGTSAPQAVAPSTAGNVLTSNGSTWQSTAPAGGGLEEFIAEYTLASDASTFSVVDSVFVDSSYDYIRIKSSNFQMTTYANLYFYYMNSAGSVITSPQSYAYTIYNQSTSTGGGNQSLMQFVGAAGINIEGNRPVMFDSKLYHIVQDFPMITTAVFGRSTLVGQNLHSGLYKNPAFTLGGVRYAASTGNIKAGSTIKIYGVKGS